MNLSSILPSDLPVPKDDGACKHLLNTNLPLVSLANQGGNLLKLKRNDTFRIVLYCFPMTGHPEKSLPRDWNNIPGARGCTPQTCSFRDHYDDLMKLNAIPIGLSTQSVEDLKEMTNRLKIPYDIISDANLQFANLIKLPTFKVDEKVFIKRLTLIIQSSIIIKVFYPVFPPDLHVKDVINWLENN